MWNKSCYKLVVGITCKSTYVTYFYWLLDKYLQIIKVGVCLTKKIEKTKYKNIKINLIFHYSLMKLVSLFCNRSLLTILLIYFLLIVKTNFQQWDGRRTKKWVTYYFYDDRVLVLVDIEEQKYFLREFLTSNSSDS
jgi:hypothetical protein